MSAYEEPEIFINGTKLSTGQAATMRCAIESFAVSLREGLGDDEHGKIMTAAYYARIAEIRKLMGVGQ